MSVCKFIGIGASDILEGCWASYAKAEQATLVGVVSRDHAKAQALIDRRQAVCPMGNEVVAYQSLDEALASADFDAGYVSIPAKLRREVVVQLAQAGKAVLTEKPGGADAADVQAMIAACAEAAVQFMDNTMFMHSTRLPLLKEKLRAIGDFRTAHGHFSFRAGADFSGNIRLGQHELGCAGDLLWYIIRLMLVVMDGQLPTHLRGVFTETGDKYGGLKELPAETHNWFEYPNGRVFSAYSSFGTAFSEDVTIYGTDGSVRMNDFVLPDLGGWLSFELRNRELTSGDERKPIPHVQYCSVQEREQGRPDSQDSRLLDCFSQLVLGGTPDTSWPALTLATQKIVDKVFEAARTGERVQVAA